MLYTVGHGARPFAELTGILRDNGITLLVDVRAVPRSRFHPQYNRGFLEKNLPVRYRWMGDTLGGKNADLIPREAFEAGIGELIALAGRDTVCIMCSEREPGPTKYRKEGCHRWTSLAPALRKRGIEVTHL